MKHLTLALVVCTIGIIHSQTFRYYKVGQKFEMNDNACLVIKKDLRLLLHLESLDEYRDVKALKLVGFKDIEFDMDSVMSMMSEFTKIKSLQFENCDLNNLTEPLSFLTELKDIRILKGSTFSENYFFPLLKNNPVESISIQAGDPGLMTDSLHLLPNLKIISLSSNNNFVKANKTITYVVGSKQNRRDIILAYCGSFFRAAEKPAKETTPTTAMASIKFRPKQLSCINQPIPGIDINDTLYSFNSTTSIQLQYESGSVINVDGNAFVTADGKNYNGPVKLFYREFRNPVEIMLSGIPMTTKMNNETMLFKSGGMYEISAYDPQGNSLNTRSDTAVKIHFALTDTSENFQFYSLNDNGNWATTSPSVNILKVKKESDSSVTETKAIREYYGYWHTRPRGWADTTPYHQRFTDHKYLYTYRTDNLQKGPNDSYYYYTHHHLFKHRDKVKSLFRIKYLKQTKDKEIIFTIVPSKKDAYYDIPDHIQLLMNKTFVYRGNMSREEFRETFGRKNALWDLRPMTMNDELILKIKTHKTYINLDCKVIAVKKDGSYFAAKKWNKLLNLKISRAIVREAKSFDKKDRFVFGNRNNLSDMSYHTAQQAYEYSKKYQTSEELKMGFEAWKKYASKAYRGYQTDGFQYNNAVGTALVKSGMGVSNIDCYIHSGQMENILVQYDKETDIINDDYNVILYKSINTSYPLGKDFSGRGGLSGYYFKRKPNYLIRFSKDGFMQITKPDEMKDSKRGNTIAVKYMNQYNVKDLSSKDITKLILD